MFNFDDVTDNKDTQITPVSEENGIIKVDTSSLNAESLSLINQIIAEQDQQKAKDLTYLFNQNQNKKTIVRVNKLNDLLDVLTDQAMARFTTRPDEISNADLMSGMKLIQDIIERSTKSVNGVAEQPLIQINSQHNEVNVGTGETDKLGRDSRERVKNAVLGLLKGLADSNVIEPVEITEEDQPVSQEEDYEPTEEDTDANDD